MDWVVCFFGIELHELLVSFVLPVFELYVNAIIQYVSSALSITVYVAELSIRPQEMGGHSHLLQPHSWEPLGEEAYADPCLASSRLRMLGVHHMLVPTWVMDLCDYLCAFPIAVVTNYYKLVP